MTDQKLQEEYYILLKEFEEGNRRMKRIKKRMAEITRQIKINPNVDIRATVKEKYLR